MYVGRCKQKKSMERRNWNIKMSDLSMYRTFWKSISRLPKVSLRRLCVGQAFCVGKHNCTRIKTHFSPIAEKFRARKVASVD